MTCKKSVMIVGPFTKKYSLLKLQVAGLDAGEKYGLLMSQVAGLVAGGKYRLSRSQVADLNTVSPLTRPSLYL